MALAAGCRQSRIHGCRPPSWARHCPLCLAVVQKEGADVARHLGRLYCCQAHANTHKQQLEAARRAFQRGHAARHGRNRLLPEDEAQS